MKPLRWLAAGLLWILAGLLGLVGGVLCITIILLPLGIPVLMLARRLFSLAALLVVPREVRHPLKETDKAVKRRGKKANTAVKGGKKDLGQAGGKAAKKMRRSMRSSKRAVTPKSRQGLLERWGLRGR